MGEMIEELRPKEQKGYVRKKMQDTSCQDMSSQDLTTDLIVLDSTIDIDSDQEMEDQARDALIDQGEVKKNGEATSGCSTPARQSSWSFPVTVYLKQSLERQSVKFSRHLLLCPAKAV